jgi:predicted transposase YbfD/YdcC
LLAVLDIAGCIATIDARGYQKRTAGDITEKKGDYVLPLKENHPEVYTEVRDLCEVVREAEPGYK